MKVCMLAYTFYETDNRVLRYAETLSKRGDQVDVIALARQSQCRFETLNGVKLYRIQTRIVDERGKLSYLYRVLKFLIKSFVFVTYKHLTDPYDIIHVHSVPDFEVFAALIPRVTGAKILLDIHDLVPEFYSLKFSVTEHSIMYKCLLLVEKASMAFSDHVIVSNHLWRDKLLSRSVSRNKCTVIMNYPDSSIFFRRRRVPNDGRFIIMYPGTLNRHQGVDIAVKAFALIKDRVPEAEFHIYGEGPLRNELAGLIRRLGLRKKVLLKGFVTIKEIAGIMANVDLGVIPKRNDSFGGEAFSTKTLEFMCLGVPITISRTKIDQYYFDESVVRFFESENEKDLAEAMLLLITDSDLREKLVGNAFTYVKGNCWDVKKGIYTGLVDALVGNNP